MKIHAGKTNYIPKNTAAQTIHTGPGKVRAIIASTDGIAGAVTLYDDTTATNILIKINITNAAPLVIIFDNLLPLKFETGLIVKTGTPDCFVITEA